jgi:coniferyl-aldehyde dehydrogenase
MRDLDAKLKERLEKLRAGFSAEPYPSRETRAARLDALIDMVERNEERIIDAISADFGNRARVETLSAEIIITIGAARSAKRELGKWMRTRHISTPLHLKPGKSRIEPQPLGVIGIVSPWNYPLQLALSPAIAALAAGDRVMIKPSELTPRTSDLLQEIVAESFDDSVMTVVTGGPEVGQAFTSLPFDHLLFTGSTAIGQRVYMAAAKNLTPVTLELGGKSPAIIDDSADLEKAASAIVYGKLYNAGQTCIAPDYILVSADKVDDCANALAAAARQLFPKIEATDDYTSIVSDRHFARLQHLADEARSAGAKIIEVGDPATLSAARKLPFSILVNPPADTDVMKEEIFGPLIIVIGVKDRDAAITHVNEHDRPLALYWFGEDNAARDDVLVRTVAGGVTVNGTLMHVAQENLPFGGVGKSGIGAYHGEKGFETFSHMKPVFYQSRFSGGGALHPPYSGKTLKVLSILRKLV